MTKQESKDTNAVKLEKSQVQLVKLWEKEISSIMGGVQAMANELYSSRLLELTKDLNIDLENEDWAFDAQNMQFIKKEKPQEVKPIIPGKRRKRGNKETNKEATTEQGNDTAKV